MLVKILYYWTLKIT